MKFTFTNDICFSRTKSKIKDKKYAALRYKGILQNINMYLPPPMAKESKSPLMKKEFSPVHRKHLNETKIMSEIMFKRNSH